MQYAKTKHEHKYCNYRKSIENNNNFYKDFNNTISGWLHSKITSITFVLDIFRLYRIMMVFGSVKNIYKMRKICFSLYPNKMENSINADIQIDMIKK